MASAVPPKTDLGVFMTRKIADVGATPADRLLITAWYIQHSDEYKAKLTTSEEVVEYVREDSKLVSDFFVDYDPKILYSGHVDASLEKIKKVLKDPDFVGRYIVRRHAPVSPFPFPEMPRQQNGVADDSLRYKHYATGTFVKLCTEVVDRGKGRGRDTGTGSRGRGRGGSRGRGRGRGSGWDQSRDELPSDMFDEHEHFDDRLRFSLGDIGWDDNDLEDPFASFLDVPETVAYTGGTASV